MLKSLKWRVTRIIIFRFGGRRRMLIRNIHEWSSLESIDMGWEFRDGSFIICQILDAYNIAYLCEIDGVTASKVVKICNRILK